MSNHQDKNFQCECIWPRELKTITNTHQGTNRHSPDKHQIVTLLHIVPRVDVNKATHYRREQWRHAGQTEARQPLTLLPRSHDNLRAGITVDERKTGKSDSS